MVFCPELKWNQLVSKAASKAVSKTSQNFASDLKLPQKPSNTCPLTSLMPSPISHSHPETGLPWRWSFWILGIRRTLMNWTVFIPPNPLAILFTLCIGGVWQCVANLVPVVSWSCWQLILHSDTMDHKGTWITHHDSQRLCFPPSFLVLPDSMQLRSAKVTLC